MGVKAVEIISIIRDLAVAGAAVATAYFASRGINNWIVELRGRTSFEVAHGLMLATYKLREAIVFCRSRLSEGREVQDLNHNVETIEQKLNRHVYENRLVLVIEAQQDFDARCLEAEALWGSEFRNREVDPIQRWTPDFGQVAKVGSRPKRRSLECPERDGATRLS